MYIFYYFKVYEAFFFQFVESYLLHGRLPLTFTSEEVKSYREKIGVKLLRIGGA